MLTNNRLIILLIIHLIVGILIGLFISTKRSVNELNYSSSTIPKKNSTKTPLNISSYIEIIDFNKPINANFTSFRESISIWDEEGVTRILRLLLRYPHLDFIDIGANIGTYTMYAAALGRFVLAIECFALNTDRIHRAVQLANVSNRVVLVKNALYTHSGQYLRLSNHPINVGGQELDVVTKPKTNQQTISNQSIINDPYIVTTITLNELVPILHARGMRGAIIKMDIEGSESFALESGSQVFDLFDIPFIQMEWFKVRGFPDRAKFLLDFFTKRGYVPQTFLCQVLDVQRTDVWPSDLCWTKKDFSFC
ncbi:unnamed protein product [Adineta steineri]|uniref:Methyltransferase FkbM domain-containing protein n=1 Tax=Adineta steineri TaxID=433720 RepID=A0A815CT46_9BILA|nr:unnamed protein product [Adineta steineri]